MVTSFPCSASTTKLTWILPLFLVLVTMIRVHGQPGFISVDCGFTNNSAYKDITTGIWFDPDDEFVEGGLSNKISAEFMSGSDEQQKTLRSFPHGSRNCYTLSSIIGEKFLLRATFTYGNYDGLNKTRSGGVTVSLRAPYRRQFLGGCELHKLGSIIHDMERGADRCSEQRHLGLSDKLWFRDSVHVCIGAEVTARCDVPFCQYFGVNQLL